MAYKNKVMIIFLFRTFVGLLDSLVGLFTLWWNRKDILEYNRKTFRVYRAFWPIMIYLDLVIVLAIYLKFPGFFELIKLNLNQLWLGVFWGKIDSHSLELWKLLLEKAKKQLTDLSTVKGGRGLIPYLLGVLRLVRAKAPSKSDVRIVKGFAKAVFSLWRGSGLTHVVKYLKTCSILLQQYVSKHEVKSSSRRIGGVAVSVTRCGLPRIIPRVQRVLIRKGDVHVITFWLSIFNLYRYLKLKPSIPDLSTIVDPPKGYLAPTEEILYYIKVFAKFIKKSFWPGDIPPAKPFLSVKSSPTIPSSFSVGSTSFASLASAVWWWKSIGILSPRPNAEFARIIPSDKVHSLRSAFAYLVGRLNPSIKVLFSQVRSSPVISLSKEMQVYSYLRGWPLWFFKKLIQNVTYISPSGLVRFLAQRRVSVARFEFWDFMLGNKAKLSKLGKLQEPAGKVRVIALVDPLTQQILKPLHDWIFSILKKIPQDGTFDQDKSVKAFSSKVSGFVGSVDMSAATDRLPIWLQVSILSEFFGNKFAVSWKDLLTARSYGFHSIKSGRTSVDGRQIFYSVGQPMGALSSWAMLALTHHFMWQMAAWRVGHVSTLRWYKDYQVLGDDSTSLHREVVSEYLKICEQLGVDVNLSKSLLSPNGSFEFAKRFVTPKGNCSPVSLGAVAISRICFSSLSNWPRSRPCIRISDLLSLYGYRFRTVGSVNGRVTRLPKRARNLILALLSPWGSMPLPDFTSWVTFTGFSSPNRACDRIRVATAFYDLFENLYRKSLSVHISNGIPFRSQFIEFENPVSKKFYELLKRADDSSLKAINYCIYEPIRQDVYFKSGDVALESERLRDLVLRRFFFLDIDEFNSLWEDYVRLDYELNCLTSDVHSQKTSGTFKAPSPKDIAKLYFKFNR